MQRWIALGLVVMLLIFGGGVYGLWNYRQSRPVPMWVPLPLNSQLSKEQREEIVQKLKKELAQRSRLEKITEEKGLAKAWGHSSTDAATDDLAKRIFVKLDVMETEMGRLDALIVGVNVTRRDRELGGQISMRLKDDVWDILGITPPSK